MYMMTKHLHSERPFFEGSITVLGLQTVQNDDRRLIIHHTPEDQVNKTWDGGSNAFQSDTGHLKHSLDAAKV